MPLNNKQTDITFNINIRKYVSVKVFDMTLIEEIYVQISTIYPVSAPN